MWSGNSLKLNTNGDVIVVIGRRKKKKRKEDGKVDRIGRYWCLTWMIKSGVVCEMGWL